MESVGRFHTPFGNAVLSTYILHMIVSHTTLFPAPPATANGYFLLGIPVWSSDCTGGVVRVSGCLTKLHMMGIQRGSGNLCSQIVWEDDTKQTKVIHYCM